MATLLGGPGWGGHGRRPRTNVAGRLDPLTLAAYRRRVASGAYDSPKVLGALANRLAAVMTSERDGVERRGPVG